MPKAARSPHSVHAPARGAGVRVARLAVVALAGVALLVGMAAGLARMGVLAVDAEALRAAHAPALLFGFVGSLVVLERAVAIRRTWAYAAPLLLSLGALSLMTPLPVGRTAIVLGLALMLVIYRLIWQRQPAVATSVQALAATCGLIAAGLWTAGVPFASVSLVAAVFLVLTIVGERIELGRAGGLTARGENAGLALAIGVSASALATVIWPGTAHAVLGAVLLVLVAWLLVVDVARVTIASSGAARYMAVCLLSGYAWLAVASAVLLAGGEPDAAAHDIVTHAVLLGFVMSMIMAHASVILPAVLRTPLPYRPWFYAPVALLQLSLIVRAIGDVRGADIAVRAGGVGNVAAIVLFLVCAVASAALAGRPSTPKGDPDAES